MNIECGKCSDFVESTERSYGDILEHHGFRPVKCSAEHDGRECLLMLESDSLRLLFVRSDGAETCELGPVNAEFPEGGLHGQGDSGWYNVISLLEFKTGKKLLTRRRLDRFLEGKEDYYAWQADMLSENVEMLFDLFRDGNEKTWKDEFLEFYKALIKG